MCDQPVKSARVRRGLSSLEVDSVLSAGLLVAAGAAATSVRHRRQQGLRKESLRWSWWRRWLAEVRRVIVAKQVLVADVCAGLIEAALSLRARRELVLRLRTRRPTQRC